AGSVAANDYVVAAVVFTPGFGTKIPNGAHFEFVVEDRALIAPPTLWLSVQGASVKPAPYDANKHALVGTVYNNTTTPAHYPLVVVLLCFDEDSIPTSVYPSVYSSSQGVVMPSESGPFNVPLYDHACPNFVVRVGSRYGGAGLR